MKTQGRLLIEIRKDLKVLETNIEMDKEGMIVERIRIGSERTMVGVYVRKRKMRKIINRLEQLMERREEYMYEDNSWRFF